MTPPRKNIMLGTAGHVDHGKTALVKMLTGCETDTLAEEKERGLTIDLGFAPCRLADDRVVGIVDVPGHVDFIRNMVAGAHGIDVVIFVVAADDGIMPQTHEHLNILTLMGLRHGLVALTKIDLVEPARRQAVIEDLRNLLARTFLAEAPICPLSNITGEGFDGFFAALNQVVVNCGDRSDAGLFRVWVEDVFTLRGPGTVITGIPVSGRVALGDALTLHPTRRPAHVRSMQVYGEAATAARAGECVALNLPELDHREARRGMLLCSSANLEPVTMAEAELTLLDSVRGTVEDFLEVHFHAGTAAVLANVAMLETTQMTAGQTQRVQLRLAQPLTLLPGERFVLRTNLPGTGPGGLVTIGGGRLLGISNHRLRRKKPWTLEALAARQKVLDDPAGWCEIMLQEARRPLLPRELEPLCYRRPEEFTAMVETLRQAGKLLLLPSGAWAHRRSVEDCSRKLRSTLEAFHAANPQRAGLSQDGLATLLGEDPAICGLAAESLLAARQIEKVGQVLACAGRSARITGPDQALGDSVTAAFKKAGWAGPTSAELALSLRQPQSRIDKLLLLLVERGILVRLDATTFIHREALEAAQQVVIRLFSAKRAFSTMEFRDALGVSRKYAVPLLDHLDRLRFTVRSGHNRTPGVEAKKRLPA